MGFVWPSLPEVVIENLRDHGRGSVRMGQDLVRLQASTGRTCSRDPWGRGRGGMPLSTEIPAASERGEILGAADG